MIQRIKDLKPKPIQQPGLIVRKVQTIWSELGWQIPFIRGSEMTNITSLKPNQVFVFGSNTEGRHGKGAAQQAMQWGAQYGNPRGLQGQTYAIITKDLSKGMRSIPLEYIKERVKEFLIFAAWNPDKEFLVTRIGCGLGGYQDSEIAPMFKEASSNVILPTEWASHTKGQTMSAKATSQQSQSAQLKTTVQTKQQQGAQTMSNEKAQPSIPVNPNTIAPLSGMPLVKRHVEWRKSNSLVTPKVASELNNGIFSLGAATTFYGDGNDDPFLEFSSRKAKDTKFGVDNLINRVGLTRFEDGQTKFTLLGVIVRVAAHMTIGVGTGYGMASAMSFRAAISRYCLSLAKTPAEQQHFINQCKVNARVAARVWGPIYEDGALAGLNEGGEKFLRLLQECVTGTHATEEDPKRATHAAAIKVLCEGYEQMSGKVCPPEEMEVILWSFRMARGYSALEKRENLPKHYTEEDVRDLVLVGVFRRLGQGVYGKWLDELSEGTEGAGQSVWTMLNDMWPEVENMLPPWLRKKYWKAMNAHLAIAGVKLAKSEHEESASGSESQYVQAAVEVGNIPWIDIHFCDMTDESEVDVVIGGKRLEAHSFKTLHGAFETRMLHCPVKFEEVNGKLACLMDGTPMQSINTKEGMLHYWVEILSGKEIVKRAAERYPNGVYLYSRGDNGQMEEYAQYINFGAIAKLGAFDVGGSATGITLTLVQFMISISMKKEARPARWDSGVRNLLTGIQGQIQAWVKAGTLKRIGRTGRVSHASKVLTSHSPLVEPSTILFDGKEYTLPTVLANPHDDLVRMGNYSEGEIVSISRAPMIAKFYGVIRFSEGVSIGHVEVSALIWALTNRGDGDGDPLAVTPDQQMTNFAVTKS